jgi:hypothetical protein
MTTPRGFLKSISTAFMRLARNGDVDGLRSYLRSDNFLHAFNGLDPERRQSVMRTHSVAEDICEARTRRRLVEPKPIHAKRAHKANWMIQSCSPSWRTLTSEQAAMTRRPPASWG